LTLLQIFRKPPVFSAIFGFLAKKRKTVRIGAVFEPCFNRFGRLFDRNSR